MITFISGGAKSGKSLCAEQMAFHAYGNNVAYIATSLNLDDEQNSRIIRHREQREKYGWETIEKASNISEVKTTKKALLIECLINLVANEIYTAGISYQDVVTKVLNDILMISEKHHIYLIVNEVDYAYDCYLDQTNEFLKVYYEVATKLLNESNEAIEVVAGIRKVWKNVK